MTTVKWLIEDGTFSEDIQPIVEEVYKQGMVAKVVKYLPFETGEYDQFEPHDCVVVLGSINLVRQIQRTKPWIPGAFANFKNMECLTYYAHFGKYLLNSEYHICPVGDLSRRIPDLEEKWGELFIRPSSGMKQFTGQRLDVKGWKSNPEMYGKPEQTVVVSPYNSGLRQEYRLFCSGTKVLGGSQYYNCEGQYETKGLDMNNLSIPEKRAVGFMEGILRETAWRPDPIFVADIGMLLNGHIPKLLEINSFSCSGWYKTPPAELVRSAAQAAIKEYEEIEEC